MSSIRTIRLLSALAITGLASTFAVQVAADPLADSFRTPPAAAQPRVWWHWMNGNISKPGIDQDLAWMKRVGIAGVQNFDAALDTPQVVKDRLAFLTPEWRDAFRHAVEQADRLGLEFAIAGSPGWSETGGPWVKPEQGMKKLVWSEAEIEGGRPFSGRLPSPPSLTGPFMDIPGGGGAVGRDKEMAVQFYRDAAVVAFRAPAGEGRSSAPAPVLSASSPIDLNPLLDGDRKGRIELPFAPDQESWVRFDYGRPQTMRALTIVAARSGGMGDFGNTGPQGRVEASDDGRIYRTLADLPAGGAAQQTLAFPAVTARYFRVVFLPRKGGGMIFGRPVPTPVSHSLAELSFQSAARVHRFEDKAGWVAANDLESQTTPAIDSAAAVRKADVIDLTGKMRPDGALDWTPPPGRWIVLRLGYSLTGRENHPASPEGTGLEVDKLNRDHVKAYADAYLGEYEKTVGSALMGKRGLQFLITDSYEAGGANWTDDMIAEFSARRGYDPRPWLPVLTGRVVGDAASSEAFLWDFRKTLGDLIADEHYGQLTESLHARGMGRYGESHEDNRVFVGDGMQVKKSADIPMGATWAIALAPDRPFNYDADILETASVAHIYGQNITAAESFTAAGAPYVYSPETLKPIADRMMANGLNRFVIHTSVHQPTDTFGPGLGLGPIGQWFTRKETWAEQAGPWMTYLARSSHLLQQGHFAADVAWFYGEDSNITHLYGKALPPVPEGYGYDFVNADALTALLSVKDGRIITPSGMSYRVLALGPETRRMSLPVLRKIEALVKAGAVVAGARPQQSISLTDDPAQFRAIVDRLWGGGDTGLGKVFGALPSALTALQLQPDIQYSRPEPDTRLMFSHRRMADGEIYFLSNRNARAQDLEVTFRVTGKAPELWRADTGAITPLSYRTDGDRTVVPLKFGPNDAVFVVFREAATSPARVIAPPVQETAAILDGTWDVSFPADHGAPAKARLGAGSWTENSDPGVKYFSGAATYARTVNAPAAWRRDGTRVVLDLGRVKNLAQVSVNGRLVGEAWKAPFEVDITEALKTGANRLEIKVANLWPNRLIGDKQPGAVSSGAAAAFNPLSADAPLLESGLIGPVRVLILRTEAIPQSSR